MFKTLFARAIEKWVAKTNVLIWWHNIYSSKSAQQWSEGRVNWYRPLAYQFTSLNKYFMMIFHYFIVKIISSLVLWPIDNIAQYIS